MLCLQVNEIGAFVESLRAVPKTGQHNPLKNKERQADADWKSKQATHRLAAVSMDCLLAAR